MSYAKNLFQWISCLVLRYNLYYANNKMVGPKFQWISCLVLRYNHLPLVAFLQYKVPVDKLFGITV